MTSDGVNHSTKVGSRGGCVWCGRRPATREHLIPTWLATVVDEVCGTGAGYETRFVFHEGTAPSGERNHASTAIEVVVKAVCAGCNDGWMSQLEERVRPALEPLVRGNHKRISLTEQTTLAHWCAKTVSLLGAYHKKAIVLDETDLVEISRQPGSAPTGFHVRLALRETIGVAPLDLYVTTAHVVSVAQAEADRARGEATRTGPPNSFIATIAAGYLAFSVAGGPGFRLPERWRNGGSLPLMIWPPTPTGLEWPPVNPRLTDRDDMLAFHEGLYAHVTNNDFVRPDALRRPDGLAPDMPAD